MSKIAFLFPGQGAQHVGMGKTIAEKYPAARALYDQANEILGYDLAEICFNGPAEKLDSTIVSQPAIFVTSLAALEMLPSRFPRHRPCLRDDSRVKFGRIHGTCVCRCDEF